MNTVKRVIAIISTILVAFPLSAVSAQAANGCDGTIPQVRGWTQINEPKFDHVVDQVRAAAGFDGGGIWMTTGAVDPVDSNKIYVTEGRQLLRSTDGGCSWKKIYELPMSPAPADPHSAAGGDTISQIVIGTDGHIYLPIQSVSFFTGDLMVSDDGGATFEAGTGLAPGSYVNSVAQAQSDPKTAYASVYFPGALYSRSLIYVTHDGGKTWTQVSDPVAQTTYQASTFTANTVGGLRVAVDPQDAKSVWAWDLAHPLHSTDGGATWKIVKLPGASADWSINALNIFHPAGKPTQILLALGGTAASYTTDAIYRSDDGGLSWYQLLPPSVGRVWAFGHGPTPDSIVAFSNNIQGTPGYPHQYAWAFDAKLYRSGHFPWRSIGYDLDGMQMETLAFGQSFGLHPHYFLFGYQAIERH